jgi:hypothetical protein
MRRTATSTFGLPRLPRHWLERLTRFDADRFGLALATE